MHLVINLQYCKSASMKPKHIIARCNMHSCGHISMKRENSINSIWSVQLKSFRKNVRTFSIYYYLQPEWNRINHFQIISCDCPAANFDLYHFCWHIETPPQMIIHKTISANNFHLSSIEMWPSLLELGNKSGWRILQLITHFDGEKVLQLSQPLRIE